MFRRNNTDEELYHARPATPHAPEKIRLWAMMETPMAILNARTRDRTHATGSTSHEHIAAIWRDACLFQGQHAEHGGVAGGADRHMVEMFSGSGISQSPLTRARSA